MQTLEEVKETLMDYFEKAALFPIITFDNSARALSLANPMAGMTTAEIRSLKQTIQDYMKVYNEIDKLMFDISERLEKRPESFIKNAPWFIALRRKTIELGSHLERIPPIYDVYKRTLSKCFERVHQLKIESYFQNFFQLDPKLLLDAFQSYQDATEKYQLSVFACSLLLDKIAEKQKKVLYQQLLAQYRAELKCRSEEAVWAKMKYYNCLNQEAETFVFNLFFTKKQNKRSKKIDETTIKSERSDFKEVDLQKGQTGWEVCRERKEIKEKKEQRGINDSEKPVMTFKNGDEDICENYDWLRNLIEAYKEVLEERIKSEKINLWLAEEHFQPQIQLRAFILYVLKNRTRYPRQNRILDIVHQAIDHVGGDVENIDAAFNVDPKKKFGIFKKEEARELLKELQHYIQIRRDCYYPRVLPKFQADLEKHREEIETSNKIREKEGSKENNKKSRFVLKFIPD